MESKSGELLDLAGQMSTIDFTKFHPEVALDWLSKAFNIGYSAGRAEALKEVRKEALTSRCSQTSGHGQSDYYIFWETFDNFLKELMK